MKEQEKACDKLRRMVQWINWQDENFNDEFKSVPILRNALMLASDMVWSSPTVLIGKMAIQKMRNISSLKK